MLDWQKPAVHFALWHMPLLSMEAQSFHITRSAQISPTEEFKVQAKIEEP